MSALEIGLSGLEKRPDIVNGMVKIDLPSRSKNNFFNLKERVFLEGVTSQWPVCRSLAIGWLANRQGPDRINLLLFDGKNLDEEFILSKAEIRKALKIKDREAVRVAYKYFKLGIESGRDSSGGSILRISRKELLQLYILAYAFKHIVWQGLSGAPQNPFAGSHRKFEGLMNEKPKRGGPLMNT